MSRVSALPETSAHPLPLSSRPEAQPQWRDPLVMLTLTAPVAMSPALCCHSGAKRRNLLHGPIQPATTNAEPWSLNLSQDQQAAP